MSTADPRRATCCGFYGAPRACGASGAPAPPFQRFGGQPAQKQCPVPRLAEASATTTLVPRFSLDFGACVPLGSATWSLALPRGAAGSGAAPDAAPVWPRRCGWRNNAHSAACWAAPEGAQLCDMGSAAARAA
jgi:hypothetical protein